ncbi:MAG: PKD domain-containing protein, partial [Planctomycetota bacterium]
MSTTAARSTPTTCRFSSWRTLVALGDLDGDDGPELAVGAPFASAGGIEDAGLLQVWSLPGPALSVDAGGPYLGVEGSPVELTAVAIPSGATVAWDVDGDGIFESPGSAVSVSYPDQGQYPVAVEASFGGESVTAGAEVTVVNGAPALEPPPERAGEPGEALIFVAVASDPGSDPLYYSWEWGDG